MLDVTGLGDVATSSTRIALPITEYGESPYFPPRTVAYAGAIGGTYLWADGTRRTQVDLDLAGWKVRHRAPCTLTLYTASANITWRCNTEAPDPEEADK